MILTAKRRRHSRGLLLLICLAITCLDQDKTAAHDGTAADLVDHLGINPLSALDTRVFEHFGEQKAIPQIMCPGYCGYLHNMVDHEPRQVDLLFPIHQIG